MTRGRVNVLNLLLYLLLVLVALLVLLPFIYIFTSSFATEKEMLSRGFFLIPHKWSFDGYLYLFHSEGFMKAFLNGIVITVVGTLINMSFTTLMAYGLAQRGLRGRKVINFMVIFSMLFTGGMIPTYLVVHGLGLINSYWSVWLVTAIAPFNLIVMRSYFQTLPANLFDAARIDGCGEWRIFFKLAIPLSMPIIITFALFYTVDNWNTYFYAVLYINDASKYPLQVFLRELLIDNQSGFEMTQVNGYNFTPAVKSAAILLTALPLLVIYPFMQKYFQKGMLLGSLKE